MDRVSSPPAPLRPRDHLRRVVNVATLGTPLGLVLAAVGRARLVRGPHGTIIATGYRLPVPAPRASAVTFGDVVLLRLDDDELRARPLLLEHEARHAEQWARMLGLVGFPWAYGAAAVCSLLRVGDAARANLFEVHAGLVDGGYLAPGEPPPTVLPWRTALRVSLGRPRLTLQALRARSRRPGPR